LTSWPRRNFAAAEKIMTPYNFAAKAKLMLNPIITPKWQRRELRKGRLSFRGICKLVEKRSQFKFEQFKRVAENWQSKLPIAPVNA
jgi:hypothetical protein